MGPSPFQHVENAGEHCGIGVDDDTPAPVQHDHHEPGYRRHRGAPICSGAVSASDTAAGTKDGLAVDRLASNARRQIRSSEREMLC